MARKYVDEAGLRRTIQAVASKMEFKLSGKISSIASGDQNNIVIDTTDPINPSINLSDTILDKINSIPNTGLIIQKGKITCPLANTLYTFQFPDAFNDPDSVVVSVTPVLSKAESVQSGHLPPTNTEVQVFADKDDITLDVIAIGS